MGDQQKFDIIFTGNIAGNANQDEVKQKAAQLFKLTTEKVDALFQSKPVSLKKNLDEAAAKKYQKILTNIGMVVIARKQKSLPDISSDKHSGNEKKSPTISSPEKLPEKNRQNTLPPSDQWELAEPGVRLSEPNQEDLNPLPESTLTVSPQEGDILKASEKPTQPEESVISSISQLSLSELGENLLQLNEKIDEVEIDLDLSHLSVEELGGYLLKEGERTIFVEKEIDVAGVELLNNE